MFFSVRDARFWAAVARHRFSRAGMTARSIITIMRMVISLRYSQGWASRASPAEGGDALFKRAAAASKANDCAKHVRCL